MNHGGHPPKGDARRERYMVILISFPMLTDAMRDVSGFRFCRLRMRNIFAIVRAFMREALPFLRSARFILNAVANAENAPKAIKFGYESLRTCPSPLLILICMVYSTNMST